MAGNKLFWRHLGLELDDVLAVPEQRKGLFCSPYGTSKGAGQHNPFKPVSADRGGQSEQAISKFDFGRLFNKENGIKLTEGHLGPPMLKTSERREVPPSSVNESLTNDSAPVSHKLVRLDGRRLPLCLLPSPLTLPPEN